MAQVRDRVVEATRRGNALEDLAFTDALTGLGNRRAWETWLDAAMASARHDGEPLCIAILDLDHFKAYNDANGHPAGDALLAGAAVSWRRELRPTDILARYGGEEFAAVLPACSLDGAQVVVERIRAATPRRADGVGRHRPVGRQRGRRGARRARRRGALRGQGRRARPRAAAAA